MKLFRLFFTLCFVCLYADLAEAQEVTTCSDSSLSRKFFENRPWFEPLPASLHEAQSSLFFGKSDPFPYQASGEKHKVMLASLGTEMPIVVWDGFNRPKGPGDYMKKVDRDVPIGNGCWGFGFWLTGAFPMVLDFTDAGQPVVDVDFKVAISAKVAYGLSDNTRLGFRFQVCHESSHVPTDFAKNVKAKSGGEYREIDVNYECIETSANLERVYSWGTMTFRGGSMFTMNRGHVGFYSANNVDLFSSNRNSEPYVGLEYMPNKASGAGVYASCTLYGLTTYNYGKSSADEPEAMRLSRNCVVGLRDFGKGRGVPDLAFDLFGGRNLYGPHRNQNTWKYIAVGIIVR
jgi:hypothetical protein